MSTVILGTIAAIGWLLCLLTQHAYTSMRREHLNELSTLRNHVGSYLNRRASKKGLDVKLPELTASHALISALCDTADQLSAQEREPEKGEKRLAVSDTIPLER